MFIIMRLHRVTPPRTWTDSKIKDLKEKRGRWIENIKKNQMEGPKNTDEDHNLNRRSDSRKIEVNQPS